MTNLSSTKKAISTSTVILGLWAYSRRLPLPAQSRLAMNALLGVTVVQVSLGISTLIYFVPVPLAAAHQAGSLTLLSVALWLIHSLRIIK
jgi:cytochrome c oxidase assembly protein subunit 15